jgi:hypothetical protein
MLKTSVVRGTSWTNAGCFWPSLLSLERFDSRFRPFGAGIINEVLLARHPASLGTSDSHHLDILIPIELQLAPLRWHWASVSPRQLQALPPLAYRWQTRPSRLTQTPNVRGSDIALRPVSLGSA